MKNFVILSVTETAVHCKWSDQLQQPRISVVVVRVVGVVVIVVVWML